MSSLQLLKGKCAIVTGSTSGIGWGIAQRLAQAGARVMLHGLEKEDEILPLKQKLESMSGAGAGAPSYSNANLLEESACKSLIESATRDFGKVDILVNNAGAQFTSPTQDFPTDKWDMLVKLNLSAPFFLSRAVLPQMYQRGWGRLIHIGSAHALVASANKAPYVATKHGILGMSKSIALEAAGTGITSNTICPGWVLTPLVQKQIEKIAKDKNISIKEANLELLLEKQPSGEFVTPEKLGSLAVYLSTDDASQVTGAALSMDGGWTVR
jgi:3-hydroxybutyrate dehydrogenase